jgi:hypothetical protein
MVWNLLAGFRFIFTFKFWSPICLGVCHQYQSECSELKVKVWNLCNGSNEGPFVNDKLAFLNYLQHTIVILSISVKLVGLWHTSLHVDCLLLCIGCKLCDIILRVVLLRPLRFQWVVWYHLEGHSPMVIGIFNKLCVCGENMHS